MADEKPRLREDLKISRQTVRGEVSYVVKDPEKRNYFQFNTLQHDLLVAFDGIRAYDSIARHLNKKNIAYNLDASDVEGFAAQIKKIGLFVRSTKEENIYLLEKLKDSRKSKILSKKGSLLFKVFPLVNPDRFLDWAIRCFGWMFSKWALLFYLVLFALAGKIMSDNWEVFSSAFGSVFDFHEKSLFMFFLLWLTVLVIIGFHELAHGLTCKRFGGEVPDMGFLLLMCNPCLYCNVTDAWTFESKWQRLAVAVAGGFVEFVIGAIFVLVWANTQSGTLLNTISIQTMATCAVSSVMFNFNPLMKLDGYYMLADFLQISNLRNRATAYSKYWMKTKLLRLDADEPKATPYEKKVFRVYGTAVNLYMFSMLSGLWLMASGIMIDKLNGTGVALSLMLGYKMGKRPFFNLTGVLHEAAQVHGLTKTRLRKMAMLGAGILLLLLFVFLPVRRVRAFSATLKPVQTKVLYSPESGYLQSPLKNSEAKEGELLFTIESRDLNSRLTEATARIETLNLRLGSRLEDAAKRASIEAELRQGRAELDALRLKVMELSFYAPFDGKLDVSPDDVRGRLFAEGEEIATLYGGGGWLAECEVGELDLQGLEPGESEAVFLVRGRPGIRLRGTLLRLSPKTEEKGGNRIVTATFEINSGADILLRAGLGGEIRAFLTPTPLASQTYDWVARTFRFDRWLL